LGLAVEVLAGALVGGAVSDKLAARNWGNLVVALRPSALTGDARGFAARVAELLARVKAAATLPGVGEVLLPGERGDRAAGLSVCLPAHPLGSHGGSERRPVVRSASGRDARAAAKNTQASRVRCERQLRRSGFEV
jgi:Malate/L-lactate dehydrogenase